MPLNLMEIDQAVARNRMGELENKIGLQTLLKGQRDLQRETSVDEAYKDAYDPAKGEFDQNKLLNLLSTANPQKGYEFQQGLKTQQNEQAKAEQAQKTQALEYAVKAADYNRNAMSRVTPDGSNWAQIRANMIQNGTAKEQDLPEQFDPQFVQSEVMNAEAFIKNNAPKKAPTTRTVRIGNQQVSQEFDEKTGQWTEVGRGDAFNPDAGINVYTAPQPGIDASGKPVFFQTGKDGSPPKIIEGVTPPAEDTGTNKPLPATSLKLQNEALDKLSIASNNNKKLLEVKKQIEDGKLNLGLISNLTGKARNYVGMSDESSRNLSSFRSTLEKLRNDSLRLNTGVQTDGDAQRAWNELLENINDPELVKQRLGEIAEINARGAELQKLQVESIRSNYDSEPFDFSKYENIGEKPEAPKPAATKYIETRTLPDGRKIGKTKDGKIEVIK